MPILSAPRASLTRELALPRTRALSSSERNGETARRLPGRSENAWYQGEDHHRRCTVHATSPAALDSAALSRRLSQLAGSEREVHVEFLLHLAEYELRRAYLEAGFGSIWDYVTRFLHYREGAAQRRIKAARVLRRLPLLAEALREGRLCMSTVALLDPLLTEENAADLVARAAFKTKAEVEYLVVSLQPRDAPKDRVRKLSERRDMASAAALPLAPRPPEVELAGAAATGDAPVVVVVPPTPARGETRPTVRPVAADTYSLRVTIDATLKRDLDQLTELLSHKIANGDLTAVLHEAVRCAIDKHGKRKGAVEPAQKRTRKSPADRPTAIGKPAKVRKPIPAEVRRQVWSRDAGSCAWIGADGRRCGSKWRLELDHIHPAALGGRSTLENLRVERPPSAAGWMW